MTKNTNKRRYYSRLKQTNNRQATTKQNYRKITPAKKRGVVVNATRKSINQKNDKPPRTNSPQNKRNQNYQRRPQKNRRPQKSRQSKIERISKNTLRIIPLGGYEEVGRNMTIFEYQQDIIILDMGIQFPEEDMPGIDYIIPNIEYLRGKEKNVRGVIFSHGHLDHIGAAPILLEKLGNPTIIGRDLTLAMVKHRQEDYKKDSAKKLKTISIHSLKDKIKLGIFQISFFQIDHSIMDAVGVIIKTPTATIIHPGDWTLEKDNKGKPRLDYKHLANLPKPTVLMLESLGAIDVRKSATTEEMQKNISQLTEEAPGRIIIGTFSSQIERIGWIISVAEKLGKKVALDGYSMKNNIEIAKKLGYIKAHKNTLITIEEAKNVPDKKLIVICTGAQGESNAILSRIIDGSHRYIKLQKSDTVILSSSIIPGNERTIQRLKDNLYRQCDNVIHGSIMDIHVSGHGNRDDILYMLKTIKPTYFIPSYAYHYMLKEAAKLAKTEANIKEDKIFIPDNGQIIEINRRSGKLTDKKVPADYVFVDGLGITDSHNVILRDRQMMAGDGMFVIIATIRHKTGELVHNPDLISRGFVYMKENKKLIEMTRQYVKKIMKDANPKTEADKGLIKEKLRNEIGKFLFQKTEKRPMILPVIIEV